MAKQKIDQETQIGSSDVYDDTKSSGEALETSAESARDDFNAIRSQLKRFLNGDDAGNWWDDPVTKFAANASAKALLTLLLTHATRHKKSGADAIRLDDLDEPEDNVDLNVSATAHGLAPKLPDDDTKYLDGKGNYTVPAGTGGVTDAKYVVGAAHDGLSAEIVKPYMGDNVDPDVYPLSPDTMDDEFEGGGDLDPKWTVENDPVADGDKVSQSRYLGYLNFSVPENQPIVSIYQTPPPYSVTWEIIMKGCMSISDISDRFGEFSSLTLVLYDSIADKWFGTILQVVNGLGIPHLCTVFAAGDPAPSYRRYDVGPSEWHYFKIKKETTAVYTSANDYSMWHSQNGIIWQQVGKLAYAFANAPDRLAIRGSSPVAQSENPKSHYLIDFFRRVA